MKPDLIVTQIAHCDYPIFRAWLAKYRDRFAKVIIYFSHQNRFPIFAHFMQEALQGLDIIFLDPTPTNWSTQDWRNVSTNYMLKYSDAPWVCSIEQDWFCKDWDKLLDATFKAMETHDLIGWWQENNNYIHPAYWFIKRETLEQTNKDFSAHGKYDHFGWITEDVGKERILTLQEMGFNCQVESSADCFHLGGVNQNYLEGLKPEYVFHRPQIFSAYNKASTEVSVRQSPRHLELCHKIAEKLPVPIGWEEFFYDN